MIMLIGLLVAAVCIMTGGTALEKGRYGAAAFFFFFAGVLTMLFFACLKS